MAGMVTSDAPGRHLLRQANTGTSIQDTTAPPIVEEALRGNGRPLDGETRMFMESRFGHSFGDVRIHADAIGADSARAVDARAFTVGREIVFGAGEYVPGTDSGRRLLAHELTHVVQQSGTGSRRPALQRQPATPPARKDIVILMADGLEPEAATLAPGATVLKVSTPEEMAAKLKTVSAPIKTLFIISHSLSDGSLGFESGTTTRFIDPGKLATTITGSVPTDKAPELIDFRGCSIGSSPQGMEKIRKAVGAKAAIGGNCFNITWIQGPVLLDGKKITKSSQVTAANRASFETGLKMLVDTFGDAKGCIIDRSETAYFRAGGKLVAQWYSPEFDTNWDQRKSRCVAGLTPQKVDPTSAEDFSPGLAGNCKRLKVESTP
jgi:hypothetical protein